MKEGWEYKKLGDVANKLTDGSHNPPKGIDFSEYIMISSQNVQNGYIDLNENVRYLKQEDFDSEDKRTSVRKGDVLLTIVGSVGRCAVFNLDKNIALQRSVAVISPKNYLISEFLKYYFIGISGELEKEAHGVAQKGIYLKQLSKLEIPIPPLNEQQRIVEEIDLLSGIIEKEKAQLEELDKLAQSIFYDMFGDPVTNEKGWRKSTYGNEFNISSGGTPSKNIDEYWSGGDIPWIGSNMCQNCIIYQNDGKFITKSGLEHSSAKILKPGSVLIALVGATIGKVGLLMSEMATNQNIANVNAHESQRFIPLFVFYHTQKLYQLFINLGDGGFKMASQGFVKTLPIILPPLTLQQEFADKISAIEEMKAKVRQSLAEAELLFNSRMDFYFN